MSAASFTYAFGSLFWNVIEKRAYVLLRRVEWNDLARKEQLNIHHQYIQSGPTSFCVRPESPHYVFFDGRSFKFAVSFRHLKFVSS